MGIPLCWCYCDLPYNLVTNWIFVWIHWGDQKSIAIITVAGLEIGFILWSPIVQHKINCLLEDIVAPQIYVLSHDRRQRKNYCFLVRLFWDKEKNSLLLPSAHNKNHQNFLFSFQNFFHIYLFYLVFLYFLHLQ